MSVIMVSIYIIGYVINYLPTVLYIFDILTSNRGLSDTETLYYYNNFYEERNPMWSCVL